MSGGNAIEVKGNLKTFNSWFEDPDKLNPNEKVSFVLQNEKTDKLKTKELDDFFKSSNFLPHNERALSFRGLNIDDSQSKKILKSMRENLNPNSVAGWNIDLGQNQITRKSTESLIDTCKFSKNFGSLAFHLDSNPIVEDPKSLRRISVEIEPLPQC